METQRLFQTWLKWPEYSLHWCRHWYYEHGANSANMQDIKVRGPWRLPPRFQWKAQEAGQYMIMFQGNFCDCVKKP